MFWVTIQSPMLSSEIFSNPHALLRVSVRTFTRSVCKRLIPWVWPNFFDMHLMAVDLTIDLDISDRRCCPAIKAPSTDETRKT